MNYQQYQQPHPYGGHSPYPTQGGYPAPPVGQSHGSFAPPPSHSPYPPQHQGHSPFPPQQAPYPPPQPPAGQYGYPPPPMGDPQLDAQALRGAMSRIGTNERQLIKVLAGIPNAGHMQAVRTAYEHMFRRDLVADIQSETSGHFQEALMAVARGPLTQDACLLYAAINRMGTKESVLNDVLLGRSTPDVNIIRREYSTLYHKDLRADVSADLSFKTRDLFMMVFDTERHPENTPVYPQVVEPAADQLYRATDGGASTKPDDVTRILITHSDGEIRAISMAYQQRYSKPLAKVLEQQFSGHMKDAYLMMLGRAEDRAKTDAAGLEQTMKGFGTKDENLVNRLTRIHWNKEHLQQVKAAYKHFYHKDLEARIKGDTSGYYCEFLVALCRV